MAFHYRKPRSLLSRHQWALWLFVLLMLATVGFFWLLGQELRIERVKDRPVKARAKAS